MKKRNKALAFGGILMAVAVIAVSAVVYFNRPIEAYAETDFSIADDPVREQDASTPVSVPPIKAEVKPKPVIEEPAAPEPEDTMPAPEVAESSEPDGATVQTPNWEAQKELKPDTDLENSEKEPEYVQPKQETSKPAAPTTSTPKNGDTKVVDGQSYTYVKGFGWVKDGDGGTTEYIDAPTTGNKVGY